MSGLPKLQLLTAAELAGAQRTGTLVLDTRPAEQFAALHIRGAVQISLLGHFAAWAAILIDPAQKLLLVAADATGAQEAYTRLARVGLNRLIGYSLANETDWRAQGLELANISTERCSDIAPILQNDSPLQLVDVRSRAEWLQGHLPGAISLPLLDLDAKALSIDPSRPSLVYCHEGYRATTAASLLLRKSAGDIGILIDGIEGWSEAGLPLEVPGTK